MQNQAVISLGSNIQPGKNIPEARKKIGAMVRVLSESNFVTTQPIGRPGQPDFINGVMRVETGVDLEELKQFLKHIEKELGRVRTRDRYSPRTIDLDVVVWNGRVVDRNVKTRGFLKKAVREVWPEVI